MDAARGKIVELKREAAEERDKMAAENKRSMEAERHPVQQYLEDFVKTNNTSICSMYAGAPGGNLETFLATLWPPSPSSNSYTKV